MTPQPDTKPAINPWNYKPWWCQPWSIALTGVGLIVGSWALFHRLWLTILVGIPLSIWMGFFLILWPRLIIESGLLVSDEFESEIDRR